MIKKSFILSIATVVSASIFQALFAQTIQIPRKIQVPQKAVLEAQISLEPKNQVQPGTEVKLSATIKNVGTAPNALASIQIRIDPFINSTGTQNAFFKTEEKPLPSIEPGRTVHVSFSTTHKLPDLNAYAAMGMYRAYKAVVTSGTTEKVVGEHGIWIAGTYNLSDYLAKARPGEVPTVQNPQPLHAVPPIQRQPQPRLNTPSRSLNPQPEPPIR
ncbi:MAG TPA: hypothetical protein VEG60_05880 [Candidatus Binatia bacterium]|nr:hypothetical protein [Candidatus Binatia bacterium]